jgi:nitrate reductase beta subunit
MAKVKNWQLGREMAYPYEAGRPEKQVAWIFDTNKCIACQTCTIACKTTWTSGKGQEHTFFNNVETKPYGFYPQGWDVQLVTKIGRGEWSGDKFAGKTVFESAQGTERALGYLPEEEDYAFPNVGEDVIAGQVQQGAFFKGIHQAWMFYLARICNHCTYPACAASCPRKAIYKRPEDGIVLIDQSRCRGYRECVRACPYKKVYYNMITRVSEKCIGCFPLVEQGEQTQCVKTCIGKIRLMGFVRRPGEERDDNPLDYLIRKRKIALPLYPQTGTEPNVFYIPPVHVPRDFLHQMFGPGVEEAIHTYRNAPNDKRLLAALLLFGNTPRILHRFEAGANEAIGFDDKNQEVVRVPYTEPFFQREIFDKKREAYRHNVT